VGLGAGTRLLDQDSEPSVGTDQPSSTEDESLSPGWDALDVLFDRPATPEDEFPLEEFTEQWLWEPYPPGQQLDYGASRSITFGEELPAFVVPTEDWDEVCLFLTVVPPEWFPDEDSTQPVACTTAADFESQGLAVRVCGPSNRWITTALIPLGVSPEDVEPYATVHPLGVAILVDGTVPEELIELFESTDGETLRSMGIPFGHQPGDGLPGQNETYC
jgi:hypothetical protein